MGLSSCWVRAYGVRVQRLLIVFVAVLLGGACTGGVVSSTLAAPASSTTSLTLPSTTATTTTTPIPTAVVEGALPDGQAYIVYVDTLDQITYWDGSTWSTTPAPKRALRVSTN